MKPGESSALATARLRTEPTPGSAAVSTLPQALRHPSADTACNATRLGADTWPSPGGEAETSPLHRCDYRVILLNCTTIKIFLSISGGQLVSKMSDGFFYKLNVEICLFLTKNKLFCASGR